MNGVRLCPEEADQAADDEQQKRAECCCRFGDPPAKRGLPIPRHAAQEEERKSHTHRQLNGVKR